MPSFSTEERQLLNDSVRDYFDRQYPFETFRALTADGQVDGFSRSAWKDYADLGWLGVALPEEAGGSNGGMTEMGIVLAGAGGALALEPLLSTAVLAQGAIQLVGTSEQREQSSRIASGDEIAVLCHYEPQSGYARDHVTTLARSADGGYVISGEKGFALHAHAADVVLVSARIDREDGPIGLFAVKVGDAAVRVKPAPALDGRRGAAIEFDGARVERMALLGGEAIDRREAIDALLDRGAVGACAEAAGAMFAVTQQTVAYLKAREQFGQPLSKFQVLQHRLVDMNIAGEEARAATHAALQALDDGDKDAQAKIWKAKVQTAKSARFVGGQAIQLHGGMGMTDELSIGHYYKRLTMLETMFGDAEWYLGQLAAKGYTA